MLTPSARWTLFCRTGFAAQLTAVVAIATLAWLGRIPTSLPRLPHIDLLGHASLIGLLAFFLDGVLDYRPLLRGHISWLRTAPFVVLSIAGIEEFLQRFGVHRSSTWSDFAADIIGVVALTWLSKTMGSALTSQTSERAST